MYFFPQNIFAVNNNEYLKVWHSWEALLSPCSRLNASSADQTAGWSITPVSWEKPHKDFTTDKVEWDIDRWYYYQKGRYPRKRYTYLSTQKHISSKSNKRSNKKLVHFQCPEADGHSFCIPRITTKPWLAFCKNKLTFFYNKGFDRAMFVPQVFLCLSSYIEKIRQIDFL